MKMFLLGVIFALIGYPVLDDITTIISQWVQLIIAKIGVKTMQYNVELNKLAEEAEPQPEYQTQAIGFELPQDYYYYDDEEE